jgi:cytochrome c biogenesis protein CcmG/thiol:disulfide interchange protein DsbE
VRGRHLLAGAMLALASGCGSAGGERLPDATVRPLDGGAPISLADLDGPAVVNLWATWCVPCRAEIPDFEAVHQRRRDEVRFVGINVGETTDQAIAFLAEVGATYEQFLDADGGAATELEAITLPVTVVIDGNGDVTTRSVGAIDQDELDDAIDRAVGG